MSEAEIQSYKDFLAKFIEFDANIKIGDEVYFRFTNNNRYRRVKVRITKLNAKSVKGACLEPYETDLGTYPKGFEFKVPRITDNGWSKNNCVELPE